MPESGVTLPAIATLAELGQYLREVRESQNLKIETIAEHVHIRSLYLRALESGEWNVLPGLAYGRGYLRRYAQYLGLASESVMEICDALQGKVQSRLHFFETVSSTQAPSPLMRLGAVTVMILAMLGWYFWQQPEIEIVPEDFALPKKETPIVLPEAVAYPPAVQECLKIVHKVQQPCYWPKIEEEITSSDSCVRLPRSLAIFTKS